MEVNINQSIQDNQDNNKKRYVSKKKVNCFICTNSFEIKFVNRSRSYGLKNDWFYWTEDENNKGKYICSPCLKKLYYERRREYRDKITNNRKRQVFTTYLSMGMFN